MFSASSATALHSPRIIPVLDLRGGQVVRGVAGDRASYQPVQSRLVRGSDPLEIARAIRDTFGLSEFYIADLDGIQLSQPNWNELKRLVDAGLTLSVDLGLRRPEDARRLIDLGARRVIAGLETTSGPAELESCLDVVGTDRLVFSLDLQAGRLLSSPGAEWGEWPPSRLIDLVASMGVGTLLILDLAAVGTASGPQTLPLVQATRLRKPALEIWTGGGLRDAADLSAVEAAGADAILVASALHDGRWPPVRSQHASSQLQIERPSQAAAITVSVLTPPGRGAVATLAVDGDLARLDRPSPLFAATNRLAIHDQPLQRVCFGRWGLATPEEVVLCRIAPASVEIHCHGGRAAVQRIVNDLRARGAVELSPFERSRETRSLLERECDSALIQARTERVAMLIAQQASGVLRAALEQIQASLVAEIAGTPELRGRSLQLVNGLLEGSRMGVHLTRPWSVVVCGRPNVGKSSLINAMAGFTRVIVSPTPGTTRDVVSVPIALDGWPVELSDTAGLRVSDDAIESAGVTRAIDRLMSADLKLLLLDVGQPLSDEDRNLLREHTDAVIVASKSDQPAAWTGPELGAVAVSSTTGHGLPELMRAIVSRLLPVPPGPRTALPVSETLVAALRSMRTELIAGDLHAAQRQLAIWL